jgi:hypothetical protein
MMPWLDEESATGAGRIATRRLDADDRVRVSTVRSILTSAPRDRIASSTTQQAAAFERAGDTRIPARRLVQFSSVQFYGAEGMASRTIAGRLFNRSSAIRSSKCAAAEGDQLNPRGAARFNAPARSRAHASSVTASPPQR